MADTETGTGIMQPNPQRAKQLVENLTHITQRIQSAAAKSPSPNKPVRLIAVSKLKPATDILALHNPPTSHLHFGENYVQELVQKADLLPRSIKWHFIGALQTNKCKNLAEQIPNLWCVSSVDSVRKADALEKGRAALVGALRDKAKENNGGEGDGQEDKEVTTTTEITTTASDSGPAPLAPLRIKIQINTSGEESKSGVPPSGAVVLCQHIITSCPHLRLTGLMTIGAIARSQATTPENENEDFVTLRTVRDEVEKELGIEGLELSMGMSADFEGAIAMGSDEVRVGSDIFGERPSRKDAVVVEKG
ncbi:alanine racemase [Lepidopterella palustris CBS 459.81]|uniref:Pyridoxal phosphate homeostasis protein n=1 Tax=Lepidopterella palustris CBS 459.81 TaxID=1314670 RepID=A0A8E2E3I6_9PEZI|nr:alanine racemase [Lepidopterella palustris CBS 459.81]